MDLQVTYLGTAPGQAYEIGIFCKGTGERHVFRRGETYKFSRDDVERLRLRRKGFIVEDPPKPAPRPKSANKYGGE